MIAQSSNSRCAHKFPSGRQCRGLVARPGAALCPRHAPADPEDLSPDLSFPGKLHSPEQVQLFLARLGNLLIRNRISTSRAKALTYICQQLSFNFFSLERLAALQSEDEEFTLIVDGPRPIRPPVDLSPSGPPATSQPS